MNDPVITYRSSLRAELADAGPPALEMLEGRQPLDPIVVLSAWKVIGLLGDASGDATLRQRLLVYGKNPPALDLEWPEELAAGEEQEDQLYELLALMGVATAVPVWASRAQQVVEDWSMLLALEELEPETQETAAFLRDALDLDASHLAHRLLSDYCLELPSLAQAEAAVAAGRRAVQRQLFTGALWERWRQIESGASEVSAKVREWLEQRLGSPSPVYAATEQSLPLHDRLLIHDDPEVCLLRVGDSLALEVDGAGSPPITLDGRPLQELPPVEKDTRLWALPLSGDQFLLGDKRISL